MTVECVEEHESRDMTQTLATGLTSLQRVGIFTRRVAEISGLPVADQAIVSGASFVTAAIIGRFCSKEQLGLYFLVVSFVLILTGIQEQVINAPYTIHRNRYRGAALAEFSGSVWIHQFGFMLCFWAALAVIVPVMAIAGATNIASGLWVLLLVGPLLLLREAVRRFAFAKMQFAAAMALDATVAALQLGSLLLLARLGLLSVVTAFLTFGLACAVGCTGWLLYKGQKLHVNRARVRSDWRDNWSFARWALPSYLVGNTSPMIMAWIVTLIAGKQTMGVYGACATIVGVVNVFILGIGNSLTARTARAVATGGVKALQHVVVTTSFLLCAVLGASFLAMLFFGNQIGMLVYGADFQECGPILATLALSVVATGIGMTTGNGLWALGKPRANLIPDLSGLLLTILCAVVLVPEQGALGAALATLLGATMAATVRTCILLRAMKDFHLSAEVK